MASTHSIVPSVSSVDVDEKSAVAHLDDGHPLVDPLRLALVLNVGWHGKAQLDFVANRERLVPWRKALPLDLAALNHRFEHGRVGIRAVNLCIPICRMCGGGCRPLTIKFSS